MKKFISALLVISMLSSAAFAADYGSGYTDPYITNFNLDTRNIEVNPYDVSYKGYIDSSENFYDVFFGNATGQINYLTEAGYEINGVKYKISDEKFNAFLNTGKFGIGVFDPLSKLPEVYKAIPYALIGETEIRGKELNVYKERESSMSLPKWSERENIYTLQGTEWRFYPPADYVSSQNPPDFSWPYVENAVCYDLVISKYSDFRIIYASNFGYKSNYYNFPYTFDKDVYYYRVRYHTEDSVSEWSETRRFSISDDAVDFPVDDIDTMLEKIPDEHPRIAVNPETSEEFKNLGAAGYFDEKKAETAELVASDEIEPEPASADEFYAASFKIGGQCTTPAICYYLFDDEEAGAYAKKALLSLAAWDPYGTSSYVAHDLGFRDLIYYMAMSYTYIRDLLTEEERGKILEAIKIRAEILINPTEGIMDAISGVKYSPYMSHGGSALRHLLQTALCLYGDLPEAEQWLREYLPLYINYYPNWGYEDGGWSQGTGYGYGVYVDGEDLRYTLRINNMIDMNKKPFFRNSHNWLIYNYGKSGVYGAEFGDQSTGIADPDVTLGASNNARLTQNRYTSWFYGNTGLGRTGAYSRFYLSAIPMPEKKGISALPKAHYFKDIGWVSMLSDMNISERTATYFKSSPYGSHNHSHADQNTFTISKAGRQLAIDSGYYDGYGSNHYSDYYKSTYAHNGITYNGGKGQTTYAMCANGDIKGYINTDNFTLASGDAKNAYNFVYNPATMGYIEKSIFDKMERHFIYVRPDSYIVIDDIEFSGENEGTLEWWLNGWNFESFNEEKQTAVIDNGTDALHVKMHYPSSLELNYFEGFVMPDKTPIPASGKYADMEQSDRINFKTGNVNSARFIATMQIEGSNAEFAAPDFSEKETAFILRYTDGTTVYIRKGDEEINEDGINSDAIAVCIKNGEYMSVDGSYLKVNGNALYAADKKVSASIKDGEISIFGRESGKVSVPGVDSTEFTDEYGNKRINKKNNGIIWEETESGVLFSFTKGSYKMKY